MNCIFCHNQCNHQERNLHVCNLCQVTFVANGSEIFAIVFAVDNNTSIALDLPPKQTIYCHNKKDMILDGLLWIFPHNVQQYATRFKKMLPIS